MANLNNEFPSPIEFFLEIPLYGSFEVEPNSELIKEIENFKGSIDAFCLNCKKPSTFKKMVGINEPILGHLSKSIKDKKILANAKNQNPLLIRWQESNLNNRIFNVNFSCAKDNSHRMHFCFKVCEGTIQKIGQYPSIADLNMTEIGKYRKVLGETKYKEFSRAIGLVSHKIGIGSFVYLRRIFENLVEEAHQEAKKTDAWDEEFYNSSRVNEKIGLLKDILPESLVKNTIIYSILSKGIHELSEEDCLNHFSSLKKGIEIILDEKLEKLKKEAKIKETEKSLSEIKSKLK
ncbi:short-chain dehydrogenase [Coleofasciculus sp. FACHB-501]|uniref:short-chain dehydrogenase n=1 Tax=Cyanophyceae TaxID=3028117 RepID=UPI0016882DD6|nr:short-chain dehydrogenase [Coleofasciculus sp. FACHB-501]MBD1839023.1 short-chain dehydrogenase [Coleofasciculus sp. FACHB-501]